VVTVDAKGRLSVLYDDAQLTPTGVTRLPSPATSVFGTFQIAGGRGAQIARFDVAPSWRSCRSRWATRRSTGATTKVRPKPNTITATSLPRDRQAQATDLESLSYASPGRDRSCGAPIRSAAGRRGEQHRLSDEQVVVEHVDERLEQAADAGLVDGGCGD
jgi:hypothetical protein